jgi:hypothetical protein
LGSEWADYKVLGWMGEIARTIGALGRCSAPLGHGTCACTCTLHPTHTYTPGRALAGDGRRRLKRRQHAREGGSALAALWGGRVSGLP